MKNMKKKLFFNHISNFIQLLEALKILNFFRNGKIFFIERECTRNGHYSEINHSTFYLLYLNKKKKFYSILINF